MAAVGKKPPGEQQPRTDPAAVRLSRLRCAPDPRRDRQAALPWVDVASSFAGWVEDHYPVHAGALHHVDQVDAQLLLQGREAIRFPRIPWSVDAGLVSIILRRFGSDVTMTVANNRADEILRQIRYPIEAQDTWTPIRHRVLFAAGPTGETTYFPVTAHVLNDGSFHDAVRRWCLAWEGPQVDGGAVIYHSPDVDWSFRRAHDGDHVEVGFYGLYYVRRYGGQSRTPLQLVNGLL